MRVLLVTNSAVVKYDPDRHLHLAKKFIYWDQTELLLVCCRGLRTPQLPMNITYVRDSTHRGLYYVAMSLNVEQLPELDIISGAGTISDGWPVEWDAPGLHLRDTPSQLRFKIMTALEAKQSS